MPAATPARIQLQRIEVMWDLVDGMYTRNPRSPGFVEDRKASQQANLQGRGESQEAPQRCVFGFEDRRASQQANPQGRGESQEAPQRCVFGWASAGGAPDASSGKIFVGGLPRHATEDSVRVYFSKFGNISDLMLKYDPQLGTHKGFGFVTFQDPAVAQQVLNHKRGHWMDARWIDCKPSSPKGSGKGGKGGGGGGCGGGAWQQRKSGWASAGGAPDASSGKLFVGGLPRHATEDSVRVYFSKFGNISDLMLKYDPQLGTHKGFAFVTFQDPAVAQQVLNHKEGHWMDGRWIDCKPSSPKGSGKGAKGGGGGGRGRGAWQQGKSGGNSWGNDWQSSWQNKNQYSDQGGSKNSGWNSGGGGGGGGSWGNNTSGDQAQLAGNNGGGG